jgi:selenocysteine-specific translation elongation factor
LAGKACTRALALMSVDKKEIDKGDDMAGLKKEDIDSAKSWHRYFQKKYKIVGYTWNK